MPPVPAATSRHDVEVEVKLKELRDFPVDTSGCQQKDILSLHASLMNAKPDLDGRRHWFCHRADPVTRELATFLLRLHAYDNEPVEHWRNRLKEVWRGCADCIKSMDIAKITSRTTYFGAFSDAVLSRFWVNFERFELQSIIESLPRSDITAEFGKSLSNVPSPTLYHILSKPTSFGDAFISQIISSQACIKCEADWPMDPPPPGYFLLVVHEDKNIRDWAIQHLAQTKKSITPEDFDRRYDLVLGILLNLLGGEDAKMALGGKSPLDPLGQELITTVPFSKVQIDVWLGLCSILHLVPTESCLSFEIHRVIMGHLHDHGPHFSGVLRCMLVVLKKLGKVLWAGEGVDYPQVVFDSIKDNPRYTHLILAHDSHMDPPWPLYFFSEFLRTVWDLPSFGQVMAKFAALSCSELQHDRFKQKRPLITSVAAQILSNSLMKSKKSGSASHRHVILDVVDIHYDFIISVSFSEEYAASHWSTARQQALLLIQSILLFDIEQLVDAIIRISSLEPTANSDEIRSLPPSIRRQMWWKVYANINAKDAGAISMPLELAARTAKLDKLSRKTASRTFWRYYDTKKTKPPHDVLEAVNVAVDSVNSSSRVVRDGLLDLITKVANHNTSASLASTIQQEDLARHLITLMLSPVEDLHVSAQTLIGQAYDVDGRPECLRAILKAQPESSFRGFIQYISDFNSFASTVAEACSTSKALVRCMTDVLDVMGSASDGILKDLKYVKANLTSNFSLAAELPKLWKAMTTSIAVIFKRTPKWAFFFDNTFMTEWMRDALIFARDLLEHRRTFEAASLAITDEEDILASPSKPSRVGRMLVEDFQGVLLELQGWLRLTDTELLYQSLALLKSLLQCFRAVKIQPSAETLDRLSRFIEQNKSSRGAKRVSFLNAVDLAELEIALESFTENDESDVEIIAVRPVSTGKRTSTESALSSDSGAVEEASTRKRQKTSADRTSTVAPARKAKQTKLPFTEKSSISNAATRSPYGPQVKLDGKRVPAKESRAILESLSSSSTSDSEDSEDEGLASLLKAPSPKKESKKSVERRKIKIIEDPNVMQARKEAAERAKKQEAIRRDSLRLKPNVAQLHITILSWNYDHEGTKPPMTFPQFKHIPDSFDSHDEYQKIFGPLLMLEAWSQIVNSKEETAPEKIMIRIDGRSHEHPWLDLDVSVVGEPSSDWRLTPDADVVLLRHLSEKRSLMTRTTSFRRTNDGIKLSLRCCTKALDRDPGLSIGSRWNLTLVFSLTTLHREYAALSALPYYDLRDEILRPQLKDSPVITEMEIQGAMKSYKVNEPQAKAILSAMRTKGFTLIQGPPGTGKTWTICGLAGAFLSSRGGTRIAVPGKDKPVPSSKLLICAPSNAAVDEITKRLIEGVYSPDGRRLTPKVVRVGAESQINVSAKDHFLDALVEARMSSEGVISTGNAGADAKALWTEIEEVRAKRRKKLEELQSSPDGLMKQSLKNEADALNAKRLALSQKLDQMRDKMKSQTRAGEALRRKYRFEVLAEADIICSTLSGAGHEQLESLLFPMVIVDEASQSVELSSLIPLKYRCSRCVLVGDPQQLPPTVLSPEAAKWGYNQSLFVRMQKHRPTAVHLLSIQYRMHPEISLLPSKVFYDGRLQDGPDMDKKTSQPWHVDPRFGPYRFYSVEFGREEPDRIGHSILNRQECRAILSFYEQLRNHFPAVDFNFRIGIVSMYRSQMQEMRNVFRTKFGRDITTKIDFNTVDGFQGQEKDIIILSCVRAGPALETVGFLSDIRRMNVAITRSKSSLFIFGHAPTLRRSDNVWKAIIDNARSRSSFVELQDTSYFLGRAANLTKSTTQESIQSRQRKRKPPAPPKPRETSQVELSSPKKLKRSASQKLSGAVVLVDPGLVSVSVPDRRNGPSESKPKKQHEGTVLKRHPGENRDDEHAPKADSSSTDYLSTSRPETSISVVKDQVAARKELEAFRRRKKEAANPFLKR